jgi:SAM-dependent methyltransferase
MNFMKLEPAELGKVENSLQPPVPLITIHDDEKARKIVETQERLRLNLGCDRSQIAGYVGVDFNPDVDPDVLADVEHLPFEDNSVDEIYASHVLEHLPYGNTALQEWLRVLKPGGMLTVVVPDINGIYLMSRHHGAWGSYSQPIDELYVNATTFGAELLTELHPEFKDIYTAKGHVHRQIFIHDMLLRRVIDAGFTDAHESADTILGPVGIGNRVVIALKPIPKSIEGE